VPSRASRSRPLGTCAPLQVGRCRDTRECHRGPRATDPTHDAGRSWACGPIVVSLAPSPQTNSRPTRAADPREDPSHLETRGRFRSGATRLTFLGTEYQSQGQRRTASFRSGLPQTAARQGLTFGGRYWTRTSDPQLVELVL